MICATCGARNPDTAAWCLQCFTVLDDSAGAGPDAGDAVGSPEEDGAGSAEDEPAGRFRRSGDAVDWRCEVCGRWNPLETPNCPACGTTLTEQFAEPDDAPAGVDATVAMIATAVLPGLGHLLLSRTGSGVARAVVYVIWLLGGWLLLSEALGAGQSALAAVPLLIGAAVVWAVSQYDTHLLLSGRDADAQLLRPRVFLWLVVGVIGLLIATFAVTTATLAGRT